MLLVRPASSTREHDLRFTQELSFDLSYNDSILQRIMHLGDYGTLASYSNRLHAQCARADEFVLSRIWVRAGKYQWPA
jgi:hypothetical protein